MSQELREQRKVARDAAGERLVALGAAEFPPPGEPSNVGAGGLVRSVDLSRVILRYGPSGSRIGARQPG